MEEEMKVINEDRRELMVEEGVNVKGKVVL